MSVYSIFHTKTHLSELLKQVKNGKEIIVTERGKPIAKICPLSKTDLSLTENLDRLAAAGHLLRPDNITHQEDNALSDIPGALERFLKDR